MRTIYPLKMVATIVSGLAVCTSLLGCASTPQPTSLPFLSGNWQFTTSDPKASQISSLSGVLEGPSTNITGVLHVNGNGQCVPTSEVIDVSGWTMQSGLMVLTGAVGGGTITVEGVVSADGSSLVIPSISVKGGTCAVQPVLGVAQNFKSVEGSFTGSLKDASGLSSILTANLSQSSRPDALGNYSLSGEGTFTAFPCLTNAAQLTNTEVTGSNVKMTYVDSVTGDSVLVLGQLAGDSQSVTVTNWTLSGGCSTDSGTGKLVQQS